MFITFEGLDFSGKTTQAARLVERLRSNASSREPGVPSVELVRDPGGTPIAERIRSLLLDRRHMVMSPETELFLFSASRSQLVDEVIRPALRRGDIVVCDRFTDSTTAYQGYGRGLPLEHVRQINLVATRGVRPDLTILVDLTVEDVERRMAAAGAGADRMESAGREFYRRVREGFLAIAASEPDRVVRVNGAASIHDVEHEVWHAVAGRMPARLAAP